jgi:hypothetical protein
MNVSQYSIRFSGAMSVVLSIIAIAVLMVVIVANLRLRHGTRTAERHEDTVRANVGGAQREDSLRGRAEVRAAAAERSGTIASQSDE